jgi:uncharacterized protein (TIGR03086 family)
MTDRGTTYAVSDGLALLERAVGYTLGSLQLVTAEALGRSTPCRGWDLGDLLAHMDDSLAALQEAVELGDIALPTELRPRPRSADPVAALRNRACRMLGAWTSTEFPPPTFIGGYAVPTGVVMSTGAVEVAVHGWDVAEACGNRRPVPASLAAELLPCARMLVAPEDRPVRFASRLSVAEPADPSDRLLAFLGRRPGWPRIPPPDLGYRSAG